MGPHAKVKLVVCSLSVSFLLARYSPFSLPQILELIRQVRILYECSQTRRVLVFRRGFPQSLTYVRTKEIRWPKYFRS